MPAAEVPAAAAAAAAAAPMGGGDEGPGWGRGAGSGCLSSTYPLLHSTCRCTPRHAHKRAGGVAGAAFCPVCRYPVTPTVAQRLLHRHVTQRAEAGGRGWGGARDGQPSEPMHSCRASCSNPQGTPPPPPLPPHPGANASPAAACGSGGHAAPPLDPDPLPPGILKPLNPNSCPLPPHQQVVEGARGGHAARLLLLRRRRALGGRGGGGAAPGALAGEPLGAPGARAREPVLRLRESAACGRQDAERRLWRAQAPIQASSGPRTHSSRLRCHRPWNGSQ